jgi:hypothetical protein
MFEGTDATECNPCELKRVVAGVGRRNELFCLVRAANIMQYLLGNTTHLLTYSSGSQLISDELTHSITLFQ